VALSNQLFGVKPIREQVSDVAEKMLQLTRTTAHSDDLPPWPAVLVRIHFIIVMIRWTGLAPWEFGFPFPGSLTSTFPNRC